MDPGGPKRNSRGRVVTSNMTRLLDIEPSPTRIPKLTQNFKASKSNGDLSKPSPKSGQAWASEKNGQPKFGTLQQKIRSLFPGGETKIKQASLEREEDSNLVQQPLSCNGFREAEYGACGESRPHETRDPPKNWLNEQYKHIYQHVAAASSQERSVSMVRDAPESAYTNVSPQANLENARHDHLHFKNSCSNFSRNINSKYDYDKVAPKNSIGNCIQNKQGPSEYSLLVPDSRQQACCSASSSRRAEQSQASPPLSFNSSLSPIASQPVETIISMPPAEEDHRHKHFSTPLTTYSRDSDDILRQEMSSDQSLETVLSVEHQRQNSSETTSAKTEHGAVPSSDFEIVIDGQSGPHGSPSSLHVKPDVGGGVGDEYKSSSESGRGTMSIKGPGHLDSSLDSDHSVPAGAADSSKVQLKPDQRDQGGWTPSIIPSKERHSYRHLENQGYSFRKEGVEQNGVCEGTGSSEAFSVTPPLPAASPSFYLKGSESHLSHKLSYSTTALHTSHHPSPKDHHHHHESKIQDVPSRSHHDLVAKTYVKKSNGSRRTAATLPASCRYWDKTRSGHHGGKSAVLGTSSNNHGPAKYSRHKSAQQLYSDLDLLSTTTGQDGESFLEDSSSESSIATTDVTEVGTIRKQLEGLETMYSEILRMLGVKGDQADLARRRKVYGSLSSLTGRSSVSHINSFRGGERRHDKHHKRKEKRSGHHHPQSSTSGTGSKRLHRLESHVMTLARSIAQLSSELRSQQSVYQELDSIRRDVAWVQDRLQDLSLVPGTDRLPKDCWDKFRREVIDLIHPSRVHKLTKFFGDEPPLLRQFLKKLGYEKYAQFFEHEKIGVMELPYMTEDRLQKIGVPMGPRMRILQEAQLSFRKDKVYIV